ncbi:MAG TPA: hypothetical protein VNV85_01160, partial [Puia sp.]|nr:hypothetical protein [Puia sp.]
EKASRPSYSSRSISQMLACLFSDHEHIMYHVTPKIAGFTFGPKINSEVLVNSKWKSCCSTYTINRYALTLIGHLILP